MNAKRALKRDGAWSSLREGYLPPIQLRALAFTAAGFGLYKLGRTMYAFFRPGPKPEIFRDYRHTR